MTAPDHALRQAKKSLHQGGHPNMDADNPENRVPIARRSTNRPSDEPEIAAGRTQTSLLLVDMQSEHFRGEQPKDENQLLDRVREAVSKARAAGIPVIALRHGWQTPGTRLMARMVLGGKGLAWAPGTEIHPGLVQSVDYVVTKRVQDDFENPELGTLLDRLGIGHLQIAGLDGCFCVKKTALAAAERGYTVTLLTDAIRTSRPTEWYRWLRSLPDRIVSGATPRRSCLPSNATAS
jgi:nicotinamidase-related amidase